MTVTVKVTYQGSPVSGVNVSFYVSSSPVELIYEFISIELTDEFGEVTFIWSVDRGTLYLDWPIMFQLTANNHVGSAEWYFTIVKASTSIGTTQPVLIYGSSSMWTVRLVDSENPLEGHDLFWVIYVDGSIFLSGTVTTNSSGYADIQLICPNEGANITIAIYFDETSSLESCSFSSIPLFEKGEPILIALPAETNDQNEALLSLSLTNQQDEVLSGYEVRFYISSDGENWILVSNQDTDFFGNAYYLCDIPYSQGNYYYILGIHCLIFNI